MHGLEIKQYLNCLVLVVSNDLKIRYRSMRADGKGEIVINKFNYSLF